MPSVTPAATAPPTTAATSTEATSAPGVMARPPAARTLGGDSGPMGSITGPRISSRRIPRQDQLAGGLEAGRAVDAGRGGVLGPGPHVPERHASLLEQLHGAPHQRLADAAAPVTLGDVDLGHLAFEAGAGVEKDDPAEAGQAGAVTDGIYDVLTLEARADRAQRLLDLVAAQLGMIVEMRLLG